MPTCPNKDCKRVYIKSDLTMLPHSITLAYNKACLSYVMHDQGYKVHEDKDIDIDIERKIEKPFYNGPNIIKEPVLKIPPKPECNIRPNPKLIINSIKRPKLQIPITEIENPSFMDQCVNTLMSYTKKGKLQKLEEEKEKKRILNEKKKKYFDEYEILIRKYYDNRKKMIKKYKQKLRNFDEDKRKDIEKYEEELKEFHEYKRKKVVEYEKEYDKFLKDTIVLNRYNNELNDYVIKKYNRDTKRIRVNRHNRLRSRFLTNQPNQSYKVCPNERCDGFLNKDMSCVLCDSKFCKHCEQKLSHEFHECKKKDLSSLNLINKMKKCPNCKLPIFRIDGCKYMTCSNCNTKFNYETGLTSDQGTHHTQLKITLKFTKPKLSQTYRYILRDEYTKYLIRQFEDHKPPIISKETLTPPIKEFIRTNNKKLCGEKFSNLINAYILNKTLNKYYYTQITEIEKIIKKYTSPYIINNYLIDVINTIALKKTLILSRNQKN